MPVERFRPTPSVIAFIAVAAIANAVLYHLPLFAFAARSLHLASVTGGLTLITLLVAVLSESVIALSVLALLSDRLLKPFCMLVAAGNAVAVYFVATYHVVLDETMMGNVLNTHFGEAAEYLHPALIIYVLIFAVAPALLLVRIRLRHTPRARIAMLLVSCCLVTLVWGLLASRSWPWLDQNSKRVGGLIMPASYLINTGRYLEPRLMAPEPQLPLPAATFSSNEKTVVVLVIGEAARAQDFQLYGYSRATNPRLSRLGVVALRNTTSCATYTTAAVRCILSNVDTTSSFARSYEPLPSYLQRNGVDVIWRTRNWGEPPLKVDSYQRASTLAASCSGEGCDYDEVLLSGLEQRIQTSTSRRVFVVLHQSGSHGPAYYRKYPARFESFRPVCTSVELSRCTRQTLLNAYDDTIVYEDYFLSRVIALLKRFPDRATLLMYLSDHGESLGEYGTYLHGLPYAIAPDVQKDIPFILWMSDEFVRSKGISIDRLQSQHAHSQRDVFHSVMGAFSMHSAAYVASYDIFSARFSNR